MSLNRSDLERLVQELKKLEEAGLEVTQFKSGSHYVFVEYHQEQRNGTWYTVRGITNRQPSKTEPTVYRET